MEALITVLIVLAIIVAIIVIYLVSTQRKLVSLDENINNAIRRSACSSTRVGTL